MTPIDCRSNGKLLGTKQACELAGISRATLKAKIKAGDFPVPCNSNQQFPRWSRAAVEDWMRKVVIAQATPEPPSRQIIITMTSDEAEYSDYMSWLSQRRRREIAKRRCQPRADVLALDAAEHDLAEAPLPGLAVPSIEDWRALGKPHFLRLHTRDDKIHWIETGKVSGADAHGKWHENVPFPLMLKGWDGGDPDYAALEVKL